MKRPKFSLMLLLGLVALLAIALALIVESKVLVDETLTVSPDQQFEFSMRLFEHSTLLTTRQTSETELKRCSNNQILFKTTDRLKDFEAEINDLMMSNSINDKPEWSIDSRGIAFRSYDARELKLNIATVKNGYRITVGEGH